MISLWSMSGTVFAVIFGVYMLFRATVLEKWGVAAILFGWFATPFVQQGYELGVLGKLLDVFVLVVLLGVSVKVRRVWTLLVCSFQLATTLSHAVVALANWNSSENIGYWAYFTTMGLLGGKGIALAMGIGAWEAAFWRKQPLTPAITI